MQLFIRSPILFCPHNDYPKPVLQTRQRHIMKLLKTNQMGHIRETTFTVGGGWWVQQNFARAVTKVVPTLMFHWSVVSFFHRSSQLCLLLDIRYILDSDSVTVFHLLKKRFLRRCRRLSLLLHPVPCALLKTHFKVICFIDCIYLMIMFLSWDSKFNLFNELTAYPKFSLI